MKAELEHNHDEGTLTAALGLKKRGREMRQAIVNDVVPNTKCASEAMARIIEISDNPEEVAYMAYSLGKLLFMAQEAHVKKGL